MLVVPLGQGMKNKALKMSLAWNIKGMRNLLLEIYDLFKHNSLPVSPPPAITLVRYNVISFHNITKRTKEQRESANLNLRWRRRRTASAETPPRSKETINLRRLLNPHLRFTACQFITF